ncbi:MAG: pre-peptidase C-terminal domain-containing protein, partial [Betaproteobacteria bacterium]
WARANDGFGWGAFTTWNMTTTHPNLAPVVTGGFRTIAPNASVLASSLFTVSDPDGDPIAQYEFWDATGTAGSAYISVNGAVQAPNTVISVAAADLATVTVTGGSVNGSDGMQVRAFDNIGGLSEWAVISLLTRAPNHAPVVTASNGSVRPNQPVLMSSLMSANDADLDAITQYRFWDDTDGGGYFTLNGVAQPWSGSSMTVNAAQLANVSYVGGTTSGSETLWARASDGIDWGAFTTWTMSTVNHTPVVTASNNTVQVNQTVPMSMLFSATDADSGDAITQYRFWDDTAGGGYFTLNGVAQPWSGSSMTVSAAQLANVAYVGGSTNGSETLWAKAYDGFEWGAFTTWTMTTTTADSAGNTAGAARAVQLGTVAAPTNIAEAVGGADTADYYSFTLPNTQTVHLNLAGNSADLMLQLMDSTGTTTLASSNQPGAAAESINQPSLAAGTYLALVTPVGGAQSNYTLALSQG